MLKLKELKKGSNIAVISPSSGSAAVFTGIYKLGLKNLEKYFGFNICEMSTATMSSKALYLNPELRAKDINEAFADPSIDGIICTLGGYESVRILPFLDQEVIKNNPKMIMGYSDATTFLTYISQLGVPTLNGPAVMSGFAQLDYLPKTFAEHLENVFFQRVYPIVYESYGVFSNGYKDWNEPSTLGQLKALEADKNGLIFRNKAGISQGRLFGGCIEVLEFIKGTRYWPELNFFTDKILFFETSEEKPSPMNVGYFLRNYASQGILHQIKGILFAKPYDYNEEEHKELIQIVENILTIENDLEHLQVVFNMDFGHTDPKYIMPNGCLVQIDSSKKQVILLEDPFE